MKYITNPIVIEAYRLCEDTEAPEWFTEAIDNGTVFVDNSGDYHVDTLEGIMNIGYTDYIIKGIKGELYPCKADIFEKKYKFLEK